MFTYSPSHDFYLLEDSVLRVTEKAAHPTNLKLSIPPQKTHGQTYSRGYAILSLPTNQPYDSERQEITV